MDYFERKKNVGSKGKMFRKIQYFKKIFCQILYNLVRNKYLGIVLEGQRKNSLGYRIMMVYTKVTQISARYAVP